MIKVRGVVHGLCEISAKSIIGVSRRQLMMVLLSLFRVVARHHLSRLLQVTFVPLFNLHKLFVKVDRVGNGRALTLVGPANFQVLGENPAGDHLLLLSVALDALVYAEAVVLKLQRIVNFSWIDDSESALTLHLDNESQVH